MTDGTLRVGLISLIGVGILLPTAMLLPEARWTVATLVIAVLFIGLPIGSSYAALQYIFPNQMRGVASAIVLFIVNFTGLGLGSFLPGLLNDHLFQDPLKVGQSIALTVAIASAIGITIVLLTMRPYRRHYAEMRAVGRPGPETAKARLAAGPSRVSKIAGQRPRSIAPDFARGLDDEPQLRRLVGERDVVAFDRRGESALGGSGRADPAARTSRPRRCGA